ncbi:MAG: hypothetical protein EOP20_00780 [Hyphomicrobiales bacterium]|nr:MAG: hypothetical protein EOP20_00780 [Hyphomicrobiales bacterium]
MKQRQFFEALSVYTMPEGGYSVSQAQRGSGEYTMQLASFSRMDEALAFIKARLESRDVEV